ncbi:hypothetical protein TREMEDRAFT_68390 [Tremella mesenterica DSM 1558]|nr:uncharacterized protein TREMEDRAFT_68390 [Tremella mesenterica DSM 1558]EIW69945.1 hypothetical protein TREMEDRAFT_68390 [Tremella mesenterica DSM 1558]
MEVDEQHGESSSASSSVSSSSTSSDDSDDDSSESDSESGPAPAATQPDSTIEPNKTIRERQRLPTLSPTPPPRTIPSFLPDPSHGTEEGAKAQEEDRRTAFRRVYMDKLVEAFGSDLEKLRANEPTLDAKRLGVLIESLASGREVFNDPQSTDKGGVDEVGVLLGSKA